MWRKRRKERQRGKKERKQLVSGERGKAHTQREIGIESNRYRKARETKTQRERESSIRQRQREKEI